MLDIEHKRKTLQRQDRQVEEFQKQKEKIVQELTTSAAQSSVSLQIKDLGDKLETAIRQRDNLRDELE